MIVTRRRFITFLCCALLLLSQASLAQQEKRDLKLEKETPAQEPTRLEQSLSPSEVVIPRSYALVVGISQYKNLAMKHQLQFSSRDAESSGGSAAGRTPGPRSSSTYKGRPAGPGPPGPCRGPCRSRYSGPAASRSRRPCPRAAVRGRWRRCRCGPPRRTPSCRLCNRPSR